jgi:predicted RNA-binding Zn ribbon-like protein
LRNPSTVLKRLLLSETENRSFDYATLHLLHEDLCLDFLNTSNHTHPKEEWLNTYDDLVSWAVDVKLLSDDAAQYLWNIAAQHPARSRALYQEVVALRETVYRILLSIVRNQAPEAADLDALNTALAEAMSHMRLSFSGDGFGWDWEALVSDPKYPIWRVLWSARELLVSEALANVRQCEGCDALFLDTSRGHRRRWCDMRTCGNRAKAQRHRDRKQAD